MLTIEQIDTSNRSQLHRFVDLPYHIYQGNPNWVPPIRIDVEMTLNRDKHPFYEHSEADFFIATRDGKDVGRLAVAVNNNFNKYHGTKKAQLYFFECDEDFEIAQALFSRAFEWAKKRGLDTMIGPKGFAALDGYGMLVEGFEYRQMMTMMNYNPAYYPKFMEQLGFEKEVDFISCWAAIDKFKVPERVHKIAERVVQRGTLNVKRFASKRELVSWAPRIGDTYNRTFVNNWEYAPLTEKEVKFVVDSIITIADHRLIKIICHGEDPVGFLFGFADVSAAIQRSKGRLFPFGMIDIILEMRRADWISVNGAGILPEFQGHGGNALLYSEMEKTVLEYKHFKYVDMTQVAETAVNMRSDLINLGGKPFKNHRVYRKTL